MRTGVLRSPALSAEDRRHGLRGLLITEGLPAERGHSRTWISLFLEDLDFRGDAAVRDARTSRVPGGSEGVAPPGRDRDD